MNAPAPVVLGDGLVVRVAAPALPPIIQPLPTCPPATVVPVAGPPGPPGPPGEAANGDNLPQLIAVHVADAEPHPVYDDMPRLALYFENGLI